MSTPFQPTMAEKNQSAPLPGAASAPLNVSRLNVADRLDAIAQNIPNAVAIAEPTRRVRNGQRIYRTVTFKELATDIGAIARGLIAGGLRPGMRLALMVPPSIDFITLVFALLKSGAIQILIDPGIGKRNLIRCLSEAEPKGFVAVPIVQALRVLLRRRFPQATFNVTVGRRRWLGAVTLDELRNSPGCHGDSPAESRMAGVEAPRDPNLALPGGAVTSRAVTSGDDPAAIIFTSGSTGPPKGVLYRHRNFDQQVAEIQSMYGIERGEVDLPCFALFGLFNAAMGVTTVLPRMDFSRPATVDPANIVEAVEQWNVTQSFASPAVWNRVGPFCQTGGRRLDSLRRVMSAGAPVQARVLASMRAVIHPAGEIHTPYGATEALPVATIAASEVLAETWPVTEKGGGVCVGRPFPRIEWRVVRIVDGPIHSIDKAESLPTGEIGELIVQGPVVTTEYVTRQEANALAKIMECGLKSKPVTSYRTPNGAAPFWHRMGDCGYLDEQGRFWFCGRVRQRVVTATGTMFTIPTEALFNRSAFVGRSALVGIGSPGRQEPAIVLEMAAGTSLRRLSNADRDHLAVEMRRTMQQTGVRHLLIYPRPLPVDIRHNAKIFRERLADWAERQLQRTLRRRCILLRDVS